MVVYNITQGLVSSSVSIESDTLLTVSLTTGVTKEPIKK
jgi:hypothetical protein